MNTTKKKAKVVKIAPKTPEILTVEKPKPTSVAALAYQYWVEAGYQGDDLTHWLRAEQEINTQN